MNRMFGLIIVGAALLAIAVYILVTSITPSGGGTTELPEVPPAGLVSEDIIVGGLPVRVNYDPAKDAILEADAIATANAQAAQQPPPADQQQQDQQQTQDQQQQQQTQDQQQQQQTQDQQQQQQTQDQQQQQQTTTAPQITFVNHVVVGEDTLFRLTEKYNTTIELMALNNIAANDLVVGSTLQIPVANNAYCGGQTAYIVKPYDTLARIGNRFGVTATAIRDRNALPSDAIQISQILCIPVTSGTPVPVDCATAPTYTVVAGDTVFSIAQRYNTTPQTIRDLNNLGSDYRIEVNQVLCLPSG